jgi:predicted O-methyltransferase YrrM
MRTLFHLCRVLAGLDPPETQVTADELAMILKYAHSAEKLVEVGCYEGGTTAALALNTPGQVYSVDLFTPGKAGICYAYWIARSHLFRNGINNVHLIKATSLEAARRFRWKIDFLFIDADHSREGVESDWSGWFPKVRSGGIIAMHDCRVSKNSPVELGSMQFYREHLLNLEDVSELDGVDSLAVFRKSS